jgi:hypothetical protein
VYLGEIRVVLFEAFVAKCVGDYRTYKMKKMHVLGNAWGELLNVLTIKKAFQSTASLFIMITLA